MIQKFFAILALALTLGGCSAQIGVVSADPAYFPVPDITDEAVRRYGQLVGFKVYVRGMAPTHVEKIDKHVELLRKQCVSGVENEYRRVQQRRNPYVSEQYRSLYHVSQGLREQLVLVDMDIRIDCHLSKRK